MTQFLRVCREVAAEVEEVYIYLNALFTYQLYHWNENISLLWREYKKLAQTMRLDDIYLRYLYATIKINAIEMIDGLFLL